VCIKNGYSGKKGERTSAKYYFLMRVHGNDSYNLQPEQKIALKLLTEYIQTWDSKILCKVPDTKEVLVEGKVCVVDGIVTSRRIPSGEKWFWNQTHSSQSMIIKGPENTQNEVIFKKLLCRRKRKYPSSESPPKYKLWLFHVSPPSKKDITFIWCERGITSEKKSDANSDVLSDAFLEWENITNLRYEINS